MSHEEATVSTSQSAMDRLKKYLTQQSSLEQGLRCVYALVKSQDP